jgi:arsenate reductase
MKKNILIICHHNSGRSQIAEAYWRQFPGDHFEMEGSHEEKLAQVRRIRDPIKVWLMNPPEGTFSFQAIMG